MTESSHEADRFTRSTLVSSALDSLGSAPVIVSEDAPLAEVASKAADEWSIRVICVTDDEGRLEGIIRVKALCDDLFLSVAPEGFIADILLPGHIEEFARLSASRTAGQLMEPPVSVQLTDNLAVAFKRLREKGLEGIPVLDAEGRPVAYLDSLRLIAVWVRTHAAGQ
jgi:CBS domain-containing protein